MREMHEKTVKIDETTSRLIDDMAYYLDTTKKSIIRDAVADFAEARRPRGRFGAVWGSAAPAATRDVDPGSPFADGSSRRTFEELPIRARLELRRSELIRAFARREASDIRVMNPRVHARSDDPSFRGDSAGGNSVDDELDPLAFPGDEPLELLVTTDVAGGSDEAVELERIARELLRAPVRVESATKLRLFNPDRLNAARADSQPL